MTPGRDIAPVLARVGHGIFQQAWLVDDRARAIDAMRTGFGAEQFVELEMNGPWQWQGRTVECALALAFTRRGNVQIELMQPLHGEGVHFEFFSRYGAGPHHLGCLVDDLDADVAAATDAGFPGVMSAEFGDLRICFIDTLDALGLYLELIEDPADSLRTFMPWRDDDTKEPRQ